MVIGYRGTGKGGLTKEIIEGLEKDLEKLRRVEENYKNRLYYSKTGVTRVEETEEEKT